jgi:8-hydroxy-5-deazaflavin:NADPH oxidoreductase
MNIGIIGSGNVGGALGTGWAQKGHQVTFGSRTPGDADMKKLLERAGKNARPATLAEAAASNDVLLFSLPWPSAKDVLAGLGNLSGKLLIDTTNPLEPDLSGLSFGTTTSSGEQVAQLATGAKVVKSFNTVGDSIMLNASFAAGKPVMFYCGDDAGAKKTVHQLADDLGFDPQDAGPLTQARLLEPFALLWISLAFQQKWGREFAFGALRR